MEAYRDVLATHGIPAPNPNQRFRGAEAHKIFSLAAPDHMSVSQWSPKNGTALTSMPVRQNRADGTAYSEQAVWVVDSEGGYHRVAPINFEGQDSGWPTGTLPREVIESCQEEVVAIVVASIFCKRSGTDPDGWETAVHKVRWYTTPVDGWLEAARQEEVRSRALDARLTLSLSGDHTPES